MVIGTGLIANAFSHYKDNEEFIIFASGVSNSLNVFESEFEREYLLLKNILFSKQKHQKLIYFSSFNVFDSSLSENNYVAHKKRMELFLSKHEDIVLIRLPIVIANSKNPNTLINFFADKILHRNKFMVYSKSLRYVISMEDAVKITDHILLKKKQSNGIFNIAFPEPLLVQELVQLIEEGLELKGQYQIAPIGTFYNVDPIFYNFDSAKPCFNTCKDYFLHHFNKCRKS